MAYESEHTKFMREWLKQHPEELAVQQSSRALWWDRGTRSLDEQERLAAAEVPHNSYCYDAN
jgi:hypothetical protein